MPTATIDSRMRNYGRTKVFRERGTHLAWRRFDDDHIVGPASGTEIMPGQAYFIIRLNEGLPGPESNIVA